MMITALVCVCAQEETIEMQKGESEGLKKERLRQQTRRQMQQGQAAAEAALRSSRKTIKFSLNAPGWQQSRPCHARE